MFEQVFAAEPFLLTIKDKTITIVYIPNVHDGIEIYGLESDSLPDSKIWDTFTLPNLHEQNQKKVNFPILRPTCMNCGNFRGARERVIPFITWTNQKEVELILLRATYDQNVEIEKFWNWTIGNANQIKIIRFYSSLTHLYLVYEVKKGLDKKCFTF